MCTEPFCMAAQDTKNSRERYMCTETFCMTAQDTKNSKERYMCTEPFCMTTQYTKKCLLTCLASEVNIISNIATLH
jgi:hypothetical protein